MIYQRVKTNSQMLIASIIRKMYNTTIIHVLPLSPLESTEPYFAPPPPPPPNTKPGYGPALVERGLLSHRGQK